MEEAEREHRLGHNPMSLEHQQSMENGSDSDASEGHEQWVCPGVNSSASTSPRKVRVKMPPKKIPNKKGSSGSTK